METQTAEALDHPYFANMRDESSEVSVERACQFEFEDDPNLSIDELKAQVLEEIAHYHPEAVFGATVK